MLSQCISISDTYPIILSMPEGRNIKIDQCKLSIKIRSARHVPERLFGVKSSPFISVYWNFICESGEYPPAFSNESEELEKQHLLFHTPVIIKESDPEWNYTNYLFISSSSLLNNEKIRFLVQHRSTGLGNISKVLAEGSVALETITSLIHDQYNIQDIDTIDDSSTNPITVTLPLSCIKDNDNQTVVIVEFSLQSIPNQCLSFLKKYIYRKGFHWKIIQNILRICLRYRSKDAMITILNLVYNQFKSKYKEQNIIQYLQLKDNFYKILTHLCKFTSDFYRDVGTKDNLNYIILEFIKWVFNYIDNKEDFINHHYHGCSLLGFSLIEDNIYLLEWLLTFNYLDLSITHWYDCQEFYIDELIEYIKHNNVYKDYLSYNILISYFNNHLDIINILNSNKYKRNIRQREYDLKRRCYFIHQSDLYIRDIAIITLEIENNIINILQQISEILNNKEIITKDLLNIKHLVNQCSDILNKEYKQENIFKYCSFEVYTKLISTISQQVLDNESLLQQYEYIYDYYYIVFSILYYVNNSENIRIISPLKNNISQILSICTKYDNSIKILLLKACSVSISFSKLSDSSYSNAIKDIVNNILLLLNNKPIDISENSLLLVYLKVLGGLSYESRAIVIINILRESKLLSSFMLILLDSKEKYNIDPLDKDYLSLLEHILSILANFSREISIANYLIALKIVPTIITTLQEYKDSHKVYKQGFILLNRLFVEEKSRQNTHLRKGWDKLNPNESKGGSVYLEKYLNIVDELMWHGLNQFCYSTPLASTSACFMVWRLLYYGCIPDNQITAFIDRFGSKFRRLWESNNEIGLRISILQVLKQILGIKKINTKDNIVHIAIEHDFLSYAFKCLKQYGTADKSRLIQVAIEFITTISNHETINYQITQDPDWIIAEHLMVCLKHKDLRTNTSVQHSGFYLIGRLTGRDSKIFVDKLDDCEIIPHLFTYIFPYIDNPHYRIVCNTAAAMLLVMIPYSSIFNTFIRLNGFVKIIDIIKLLTNKQNDKILLYCIQIIYNCCYLSPKIKEKAQEINVKSLIENVCINHPNYNDNRTVRMILEML